MKKRSILAIIIVLFIAFATPAMALDLYWETDWWGPHNFYEIRKYDKSYPDSNLAKNRGGWLVGILVFNAALAGEIERVEITPSESNNGFISTTSISSPLVYTWPGELVSYDYSMFYATKNHFDNPITIKAMDLEGNPVNFYLQDGNVVDTLQTNLSTTALNPPVPEIRKMKTRANGNIVMVIDVPYTKLDRKLRVRIYEADGLSTASIQNFDPPFEIVREDSSIDGDAFKTIIPAEFAGRKGRIEYRVFEEGTGFMCRGIRFFQLP